jgi:L-asparaginase II
MSVSYVEVWRGAMMESRHRISAAVVDASGTLRGRTGDAVLPVYARSAIKPIQALPLVEDEAMERLGLTAAELALACGSHSGEARHVEVALSLLRKAGADEDALVCGAHAPFNPAAAQELRRRGLRPGRIHNNCSGKHAGMMALARINGWSLTGYHEAHHPVQQRMQQVVVEWSGVPADELASAADGCGVVTFGLPLDRLALTFARLSAAARRGDHGPAAIVSAMTRHAEMVAGTDRLCTALMRATGGRIVAKVGAEGVYCAGVPGAELGVALKVEDGARRAAGPALIAVLRRLGVLTDEESAEVDTYAAPMVRNTRGDAVGVLRTTVELEGG